MAALALEVVERPAHKPLAHGILWMLPGVDIPKVEVGQPAQTTIDALPDRIFSGAGRRSALASEAGGSGFGPIGGA